MQKQPATPNDIHYALKRHFDCARALNDLIAITAEHGEYRPDMANGADNLFKDLFDAMEAEVDSLHAAASADRRQQEAVPAPGKPLSAEARRKARVESIGLILRDTDYSLVAERYALPPETIRDILYAMKDAPQRVHADRVNADEWPSGMTPVKPIDFEGFITGEADAERVERIKRTVDRMTKKDAPDDDADGERTGTDD